MEPRLLFLILAGIAVGLSCLAGYWRRKAGNAAFAAALLADKAEERDRYCRLAVMAGNRDACRMFCFAHPDFSRTGIRSSPSASTASAWRSTGTTIRRGTKGCSAKNSASSADPSMPSRRERTTAFLFQGLHGGPAAGYGLVPHHVHAVQQLDKVRAAFQATSLVHHDPPAGTDLRTLRCGCGGCTREPAREQGKRAHSGKELQHYGKYQGKRIIIIDDVFTSGQSLLDFKGEIERCGGEVVAAIFYGKTVTMPPLFLIKAHVWGEHIVRAIKHRSHVL